MKYITSTIVRFGLTGVTLFASMGFAQTQRERDHGTGVDGGLKISDVGTLEFAAPLPTRQSIATDGGSR